MGSYEFQIIDILSDDTPLDGDFWNKEFVITFYGKTTDGDSIVCNVNGFKPYFYMRIPDNWSKSTLTSFMKYIKNLIPSIKPKGHWTGLLDHSDISKSYNFYGYNYDTSYKKIKKYKFAKLSFQSYGDMKRCSSAIQDIYKLNLPFIQQGKIIIRWCHKKKEPTALQSVENKLKQWFLQEHNCDCVANLYESKIHPILRFLHHKDIQSTGWIRVTPPNNQKPSEDPIFNVDIQLDNIYSKHITPLQKDNLAKFVTASFDIECDSSHGDFPNPTKDCKKVAIDIHESYFRLSHNCTGDSFQRQFILQCVTDAFDQGSDDVQTIYTLNGKPSELSIKQFEKSLTDSFLHDLKTSKESSKTREKAINDMTTLLNNLCEYEKWDAAKGHGTDTMVRLDDGRTGKVSVVGDNGSITVDLNGGGKATIKHDTVKVPYPIIVKGDPIIQIGTVFHKYGDTECYDRSIVVSGNDDKPEEKICDDIDGINVYECQTERELLLKWKDIILHHNPDLITGYNIFGFDFEYISKRVDFLFPCSKDCKGGQWARCHHTCPKHDFYRLGRLMRNKESDKITSLDKEDVVAPKITSKYYGNYWERQCKMMSKQLSSSGLGDNILKYIAMDGRVVFDIQKEIQKSHSLDSYKLDNVSAHFMKGTISKKLWFGNKQNSACPGTLLETRTLGNLKAGDYITIRLITKYGNVNYHKNHKFKIIILYRNKQKRIFIDGQIDLSKYTESNELISYEWCLAKDDVSPQQIFDYHKNGRSKGRAIIAKYCIMDCELCIHLLQQLDIIPNNMGMAAVSSVPLSYIFLRGQGIKIFSLVSKTCSLQNTRIPTLQNFNGTNDEGFEGAVVLEPTPGIYSDDPICVLDFASLYPNSICEQNASHETYLCSQEDIELNPTKYDWIANVPHKKISYDDYRYETKGKTVHKFKTDTKTTCYFAKEPKGIIPLILETLLGERKKTRKLIKETNDPNKQKVLDGLQLAYKVSANSVYGQMGAKHSSICFKKIAACTTSIGRERINDAEEGVKEWAQDKGYYPPEVIYGDTDSVFVKFSRRDKDTGKWLEGKEALKYCIKCGIESGKWITDKKWKPNGSPQDLEYEKTFWPFILISKKRYTGDKYEFSADKPPERTSMGIVMKRRDNAPIVKYVFGNVVEIIMHQKSVDKAMVWLRTILQKIKDGDIEESMFIISKSLSGYYKNPAGIAHKVLADRMAERNPGNKPKPNDRIPFMYREVDENPILTGYYKNKKPKLKKRKILQGDRIEHPDYISENNLKIDYKFYISNQIMNPVKQVLDLEKDEAVTTELFKSFI